MKTFERYIMHTMHMIIVVSLTLMVIMVFSNVVLRYVFNSGISFTEELSRFLFLWLIFIGSIVAMKEGAHLGVDSLVVRVPRVWKIIFMLTSNVLMLWICYLFFVGSWVQTKVGWGTLKPATGIPMAFHYGVGLVMSVGIAVILVANIIKILSGQITDKELVSVAESEEIESKE